MRSAPAPDLLPIPGMVQGTIVAGGGGGSGGDDGSGGDGSGNEGAGGGTGGDDGSGDKRDAESPNDKCTKEGEPFDVATGRVLSDRLDFSIAGVFALEWCCYYSSRASDSDASGLGHGWTHSFGWCLEVERQRVTLHDDGGVTYPFPALAPGTSHRAEFGRTLRRDPLGNYSLYTGKDTLVREFAASTKQPNVHLLRRVVDDHGNAIELTYEEDRLVALRDTVGRILQLRRDRNGRIAAVDLKRGQDHGKWVSLVRYAYSATGDLVSATDPEGHEHRYSYDDHLLTSFTNRNGLTFYYRYDQITRFGRCIETWGSYATPDLALAPDLSTQMAWGRGHRRIKGIYHRVADYTKGMTVVANTKSSRRYSPDPRGLMTKTVGEAGNVITQEFDEFGERTLLVDGDEGVWRWIYDSEGRVVEHIDALGRSHKQRFQQHRLPTEIEPPNGGVWRIDRDRYGRKTQVIDPCGGRTTWHYDERGMVAYQEREGRGAASVRRNALGQVVVYRHRSTESSFAYDDWGRLVAVRAADGGETTFQYNDRGDLLFKRDAGGRVTQYQYDGEQNLVRVTAPDGSVRVATYGGFNWIVSMTDGAGYTTRFEYDWEGEIVAVLNPGGERSVFEYDSNNRVVREQTFDGRIIRYTYTPGGKLRQRIEADGTVTNYEWDAANNLVAQEYPDGTGDRYAYDALDFVTEGTNDQVKVFYARDLCGRVLTETIVCGGKTLEVKSSYHPSGLRKTRTVDGHDLENGYDRDGMLVSRTYDRSRHQQLKYDSMGRLSGWEYANGAHVELTYNTLGALTRTQVLRPKAARVIHDYLTEMAGWQAIIDRAYEYSGVNELVAIHDVNAGETQYVYDRAAQLLERKTPATRELFSYDAVGNLAILGRSSVVASGGKLLQSGNTRLSYDDVGQVRERRIDDGANPAQIWTYEWCGPGHLAAAIAPDRTKSTFSYDAFGRRVRKRSSKGEDTFFAWDANSLAAEVRTTPTSEERRVYVFEEADASMPIAQWTSTAGWFDFIHAPVGTPTELVNDTGEVGWSATLRAFGEMEHEQRLKTDTALRFPGQYADDELGLHYNRFRYYDPSTGRYMSPDPLGVEGGLNAWSYAPNPVGWSDPLGLEDGAALQQGMINNNGQNNGPACPPGFQAHHLIAEELYNTPGYKQLLGGTPHTADNGIYLPSSQEAYDAQKASGKPPQPPGQTIHCGRHSSAYNNYVKGELDKIKGMKPCQKAAALAALKADLRDKMQNGTFSGTSTSGKSVTGLNKNGNVTP
jgi:RHS repeat-associated protein